MSNKSVIDKAIEQMQQKMADSRGKRTGDYRIGLDAAINILENLRDIHKEEIESAYISNSMIRTRSKAKDYYNETYGGNK
jgi:hypothetical protein